MKLALVHDWFKDISGAERVLMELHKIFPEAPIFVLFYDKKFAAQELPGVKLQASFLQKIPFITKIYPWFAWLMPSAIESFDLSEFNVVLSSSAIFSKGLVLNPSTRHICYCYSPTRFLWDNKANYGGLRGIYSHLLRLWDRSAADRPDEFVAISKTVQERIKKYYRADSKVIYPPIRQFVVFDPLPAGQASLSPPQLTSHWSSLADDKIISASSTNVSNVENQRTDSRTSFYLIVSRLYRHKNIDVAIKAFNKLGYPLVIIGDGPEKNKLKKIAAKNIKFLGTLSDAEVANHYASCRAFIIPQEEDFGLTPVEAMSFGKPVVALRKGGALETVIEGETGEFFNDPIPEALADAIRRLNENYSNYDPAKIKAQAAQFSENIFKDKIKALFKAEY